jgi:hypothetical protein
MFLRTFESRRPLTSISGIFLLLDKNQMRKYMVGAETREIIKII